MKIRTPLSSFTSCLLVFLFTCHIVQCSKVIHYDLLEALPKSSFVGDVKKDSNISLTIPGDQTHRLRFEFRSPNSLPYRYFSMDDQKGVIRIAQVIDREEICLHSSTCDLELDVKVKPVEYFQVFKVIIHIIDDNDNAPTFPSERVEIGIVETTQPGALFLVPTALDADSGNLGIQEYQILPITDVFDLQVTDYVDGSKDIRLKLMKRLDREVQDYYVITVFAIDGGEPQKTGSVVLDIKVLDSNDNNPKFDSSAYGVTIYENLPEGSIVATVRATDPDHGQSGAVVYSFSDNTEKDYGKMFRIDERTGEIYLRTPVDYETATSYQLVVVATDLGTGSLPAFAKVTIDVVDLNDNPPVISVNVLTGSGKAEIRENSEPGTFVAHAAVRDVDKGEGGKASCSIDGRGMFRLESMYDSEYKLVTAVTFDREQASAYTVTLTCRDNGVPSLTSSTSISVTILDENDHSPHLAADVFTGEVTENTPAGFHVITINASDADHGKNSAVLYQLKSLEGTPENTAEIDPISGAVKTSRVFDYEERSEYRYLVTVYDQGAVKRSATSTLLLYVIDVNDERPVFSQQSYRLTTVEKRQVGTTIGEINATDSDKSEKFRKVSYRIEHTDELPFEIHSSSGEIYNSRDVDREKSASYRFTVVAFNQGFPGTDARVNVSVNVLDVNDNNPVFIFPGKESQTVEISSTAGIGAVVARIVASDADEGKNAELTYSITNGNVDGRFDIHASTGVIILANEFEQTDVSRLYKLVVVVKDGGEKPLTSVADLRVVVNATTKSKSSAEAFSAESLLSGTNAIIIAGAGAGLLLIVVCLILAVVCIRRNNRRVRKKLIDQMMSAGSPCSHRCQSPVCSSRQSRGKPEGSLTTVDTCSLRSAPPGSGHYRHHTCGEFRESTLEDDQCSDLNEPWSQRDGRVMMNSHIGGDGAIVAAASPGYRGGARYGHRERSRSPRAHYPGAPSSGSNCSCASCQPPRRQPTNGGGTSRHNNSRPQSPEYIQMHGVGRPRVGMGTPGFVAADSGSLCSWPDSGRGPSEEDDPQKTQLEPLLKDPATCHCSHQCNHQKSITGTL